MGNVGKQYIRTGLMDTADLAVLKSQLQDRLVDAWTCFNINSDSSGGHQTPDADLAAIGAPSTSCASTTKAFCTSSKPRSVTTSWSRRKIRGR